jgi:hypothetical protein
MGSFDFVEPSSESCEQPESPMTDQHPKQKMPVLFRRLVGQNMIGQAQSLDRMAFQAGKRADLLATALY